uniref:uncharacterized protein n=1 Tax=Myxine glutinosa TaxID=7769 RepID=UPI00358DDC4D
MSKSYQLVDPLQPGQSKAQVQTDWNKCVLCQKITRESLQCPAESKRHDVGVGYSTIAFNIRRFNELHELPMPLELGRLDDGNGIEATFLENNAKWHKSCHTKFNNIKLQRAEKRKCTQGCDPDATSSKKYTRQVAHHEVAASDVCFLCEDVSTSEPLREASTFRLDSRVRRCALDLQDERLLAKLSAGDMVAQDAKYHPRWLERTEMAVLIVEGKAHQLASTNGKVEVRELPTIYSNQEETDTRVVLYLHHAATIGYKNAVVRTPDTDILLILLHHAHNIKLTVYLDTGSGKHRQLVNVSELAESLGEDYCATLLGYYVFSGEDCTSAFKGKGKVGPLKKLEKNPRFHRAFGELGDNWDANPEVERQLEKFTCVMYGQSRESSVDIVRAKLLRKMVGEDKTLTSKSKVDLARLPPCQSALKPHIQRVNHRVALYKRADQPIIEKPKPYEEQGWIRTDEGLLKPMWSSGPILPTSLVDLLNTGEHEEEEEEEGEEEFDSDDFDENDDD